MNDIRLTVVVPVYNAERFLKRCADSVLAQDIDGLELLFIDDGSTDGSGKLLDALAAQDARVRVIRRPNGGVSAARNGGIREAHGAWLTLLDADDTLLPGGLRALLAQADDGVDCVRGGAGPNERPKSGSPDTQRFLTPQERERAFRMALEDPTRYLTCHGWLLRARLLRDNELRFREELALGEDGELMIRCLRLARGVAFTARPVYAYTLRGDSAVHRYREDLPAQYLRTLEAAAADVPEAAMADSFALYTLAHLLLILTHGVFHPENPASVCKTWRDAGRLCKQPVFREAFRNAAWNRLGPARRFTLRCLQLRLIPPAWLAVRLRQRQNARRGA